MRVVLDENLPSGISEEIKNFQTSCDFLDVNEEHKGILDFELVDKMGEEDIMVTGDLELHKNLLDRGRRSVYYDKQLDNLIEVQVKTAYYLKGAQGKSLHTKSGENEQIVSSNNEQLRRRFEELKKENAALRSRVNVLEGKIESILNTAESAVDSDRTE